MIGLRPAGISSSKVKSKLPKTVSASVRGIGVAVLEAGKPIKLRGAFQDISKRKELEEKLRKADTLINYASMALNACDALITQDMEGRIIAWNPGAVRLYGWSEVEALVMNIHAMIPEQLRVEVMGKIIALSEAEAIEVYCTQRIAKDGSILEVSMSATALLDDAGKVYAIATTHRAKRSSPTR